MTQPKIKTNIEARVKDTGDTMTGDLRVNATVYAGSNVKLCTTSTEGGNIRLITPENNSNIFEIDTCNNLLRIYYSEDSGESGKFSWTFQPNGMFYSTYISTGNLFVRNLFYSDASSLGNEYKAGIYQWDNQLQFTWRDSSNTYLGTAFYINVEDGTIHRNTLLTSTADSIIEGKEKGFKVKNGNYQVGVMIGSGGVNRGLFDFYLNKWMVYSDGTNTYLNGRASLDSLGNNIANTYKMHKVAYAANMTSGASSGEYWYKIADISYSGLYLDENITFYVCNYRHGYTQAHGILQAHILTDGEGKYTASTLQWDYCGALITYQDFVLAHNTDISPTVCELWVRVRSDWDQYHFIVLNEGTRLKSYNGTHWNLYHCNNINKAGTIDSNLTQQISVLKNTQIGNLWINPQNTNKATFQVKNNTSEGIVCTADNEGGNIYVYSGNGNTNWWELDSYNGNFRWVSWLSSSSYKTGPYINKDTCALYGAVWNDYAEYRDQENKIKPGYCVRSQRNGKLRLASERLDACDGVVSDTFGFAIGETDECQTPIAVSGRVLVYVYGDREEYEVGDCLCAGPRGLAYKMTREEIKEYPDRIVGIVSEIPDYEVWGTGEVLVDGRIWIRVR